MGESVPEVIWDKEIDVPEKWIQFVDDNVVASTFNPVNFTLEEFYLTAHVYRTPTRHSSSRNLPSWSQLLDADSRNRDRAGRLLSAIFFPKSSYLLPMTDHFRG